MGLVLILGACQTSEKTAALPADPAPLDPAPITHEDFQAVRSPSSVCLTVEFENARNEIDPDPTREINGIRSIIEEMMGYLSITVVESSCDGQITIQAEDDSRTASYGGGQLHCRFEGVKGEATVTVEGTSTSVPFRMGADSAPDHMIEGSCQGGGAEMIWRAAADGAFQSIWGDRWTLASLHAWRVRPINDRWVEYWLYPNPEEAVVFLTNHLTEPYDPSDILLFDLDPDERLGNGNAIEALGLYGPDAEIGAPALMRMLEDEDLSRPYRTEIECALLRISGKMPVNYDRDANTLDPKCRRSDSGGVKVWGNDLETDSIELTTLDGWLDWWDNRSSS